MEQQPVPAYLSYNNKIKDQYDKPVQFDITSLLPPSQLASYSTSTITAKKTYLGDKKAEADCHFYHEIKRPTTITTSAYSVCTAFDTAATTDQ